jgi:hypothetical protein
MPVLVLLGPQRFEPTVRDAVASLDVRGPIATVTAGWQERESEADELEAHLGREVVGLSLYARYDEVLARDPELAAGLRDRQRELRQLQRLYRIRLDYALEAAREMMRRDRGGDALLEQRRSAIRAIRLLDRQHLRRLRRVHEAFEERWHPARRPSVARQRDEIAGLLARCEAVAVAGGHVSVLLNRMRLFDLPPLIDERPVVAWSAGAMAVSESVVLFHDSPPQGAGNPEVLDAGLALCRRIVALPHASRRLRLDDPVRVALFARRFSPAVCVVLEGAARLSWADGEWSVEPGTQALTRTGRVRPMSRG